MAVQSLLTSVDRVPDQTAVRVSNPVEHHVPNYTSTIHTPAHP